MLPLTPHLGPISLTCIRFFRWCFYGFYHGMHHHSTTIWEFVYFFQPPNKQVKGRYILRPLGLGISKNPVEFSRRPGWASAIKSWARLGAMNGSKQWRWGGSVRPVRRWQVRTEGSKVYGDSGVAPPKTNIDTKNDGLENVSPFKHGYFR